MNRKHFKPILAAAIAGLFLAPCRAAEKLDVEGVWNATAHSEDNPGESRSIVWTFTKDGDGYTGTSLDESGRETTLDRIVVDGNKLTIEVDFERDGNEGVIRVVAEGSGSGKMAGEWSIVGADGIVYMKGKAEAEREFEADFSGEWHSVSTLPDGEQLEATLNFEKAASGLGAKFTGREGRVLEVSDVKADGKVLRMEFQFGAEQTDFVIEGELESAGKVVGKWIAKDADGAEAASGDWHATRKAASLAGDWNVTAGLPDGGVYNGVLTLAKDGDSYTGKSTSSDGDENELATVDVSDGNLEFTVPLVTDEGTGTITVKAKPAADGSLAGNWDLKAEGSEETYAEGTWKAVRQK